MATLKENVNRVAWGLVIPTLLFLGNWVWETERAKVENDAKRELYQMKEQLQNERIKELEEQLNGVLEVSKYYKRRLEGANHD